MTIGGIDMMGRSVFITANIPTGGLIKLKKSRYIYYYRYLGKSDMEKVFTLLAKRGIKIIDEQGILKNPDSMS